MLVGHNPDRRFNDQFEQTEAKLLLQSGSDSKTEKLELEDLSNKIKFTEAGIYYPDWLGEHIFLVQEELQQILTGGCPRAPANSERNEPSAPPVSLIVHSASV